MTTLNEVAQHLDGNSFRDGERVFQRWYLTADGWEVHPSVESIVFSADGGRYVEAADVALLINEQGARA